MIDQMTRFNAPKQSSLGGGNSNIFYVHPYLGKVSHLTNIIYIIQKGWFNHQLDHGFSRRVHSEYTFFDLESFFFFDLHSSTGIFMVLRF